MISTEFRIDIGAFHTEEEVIGAVRSILDLYSNKELMEVLIKGAEGNELEFYLQGLVVILTGSRCE